MICAVERVAHGIRQGQLTDGFLSGDEGRYD